MISFAPASKEQMTALIAIEGASGSGKTWTALEIAKFLCTQEGGKTYLIDTENSARIYASDFDFEVGLLNAPYRSKAFEDALHAAERAPDCTVIIIDSLSPEWNGAGGCLNQASQFQDWKNVRPPHHALIQALLHCPKHLVFTMRAKEDHAMVKDERGKTKVIKLGLGAIQDKEIRYEPQLVLTMDREHNGTVTKSRCEALDSTVWAKPGADFAAEYYTWLRDGVVPVDTPEVLKTLVNQAKNEWLQAAHECGMISNERPTSAERSTLVSTLGATYTEVDGADRDEIALLAKAGLALVRKWEAPSIA